MAGDGQGGSSGGGNEKGSGANGRRKVGREKENVLRRERVAGKWVGNGDGWGGGEGGGVKMEGMLQQGVVGVASQTALELFVGRHDGENMSKKLKKITRRSCGR